MKVAKNVPWSEIQTVSNKHTDWFMFRNDTKQWVRVIQRGGGDFKEELYIELHPTTMRDPDSDWSGIRNGLVKSTTEFGKNNYYHHCLPKYIVDNMNIQLGERVTNILMNFDFVPRNKNEDDLIKLYPRIKRRSPIFETGVPLVFLGATLLSNKDHSLMISNLDEYYAAYNKTQPRSVTLEESTGLAYAFKEAMKGL